MLPTRTMELKMKYLTTEEVSELIGVTVRQVQKLIKAGRIKAEMKSGVYLVKESSLINYKPRHPGRQGKNEC